MKPLAKNTLYKITLGNGRSCHGGDLRWSLPVQLPDGDWLPGEWHIVYGPLALCSNGLHLTSRPAEWWKGGNAVCWLAEHDDEIVGDASDRQLDYKIAARRARLLRPVPWEEVNVWSEGRHAISGDETCILRGTAQVEVRDSGRARLYGNAIATAFDRAVVTASENSSVTAHGCARVYASSVVYVAAHGNSKVTAEHQAEVYATDDAEIEAFNRTVVSARGRARVTAANEARVDISSDGVTVRLQGRAIGTVNASVTSISASVEHNATLITYANPATSKIDLRGARAMLIDRSREVAVGYPGSRVPWSG